MKREKAEPRVTLTIYCPSREEGLTGGPLASSNAGRRVRDWQKAAMEGELCRVRTNTRVALIDRYGNWQDRGFLDVLPVYENADLGEYKRTPRLPYR